MEVRKKVRTRRRMGPIQIIIMATITTKIKMSIQIMLVKIKRRKEN